MQNLDWKISFLFAYGEISMNGTIKFWKCANVCIVIDLLTILIECTN